MQYVKNCSVHVYTLEDQGSLVLEDWTPRSQWQSQWSGKKQNMFSIMSNTKQEVCLFTTY